jgi:hypothetical protein
VFVTAGTPEHAELLGELLDAVQSLGLDAQADHGALVVDGSRHAVLLVARAHPTPADLTSLVRGGGGRGPVVVVADRISDAGREVLRADGWGWLDRRGHVRLWAPGLRVESPLARAAGDRVTTGNIWTTVGLEIALHALVHPDEPVTARRLAPVLDRSVGATHEMIGRFAGNGLIGPHPPPCCPSCSGRPPPTGPTATGCRSPVPIEQLGSGSPPRSWSGSTSGRPRSAAPASPRPALPPRAATCAPRSAAQAADWSTVDAPTRCWVRRAPVTWLPLNEDHLPDADHPWTVAHPVLCAVRLAADPARGREIVEDWGIVPVAAGSGTEGIT